VLPSVARLLRPLRGRERLPSDGWAALPALLAALTLVGVAFATVGGVGDPRLAIVAAWFWIGLAGIVLTVEAPAFQRAAELAVTLPLLAAVVLVEVAARIAASARSPAWIAGALVAAVVVGLMVVQSWSYFVDYADRTDP